VGIGDDAAAWEIVPDTLGLLTVDTMVEGVHAFPHEPSEVVGARALTAAVSDIPAMGGVPLTAVIALQVPAGMEDRRLEGLYEGIAAEADRLEVAVAGGDVVDTPGPFTISVTVFGTVAADRVWRRSGARPGDVVAVTGHLGGSRAGVELLALGEAAPAGEWAGALIERHLRPRARVRTAAVVNSHGGVHGGIDISDGLSSECWHLALASGVRVRLSAGAIPVHPDLTAFLDWKSDPGRAGGEAVEAALYALDSGEEFELLLTLPPDHPVLAGAPGGEVPLTVIGSIEEGEPDVLLTGAGPDRPVTPGGWSHRESDRG
jgi:thiamine-monophosphate kinase